MVEDPKRLSEPYEIFELADGETRELVISRWHQGEVTIYPAHKPAGKVINALRVWVPEASKDYFPYYWDITSKTLIAQLLPQLEQWPPGSRKFIVTKHGIPPKARFSLEVRLA